MAGCMETRWTSSYLHPYGAGFKNAVRQLILLQARLHCGIANERLRIRACVHMHCHCHCANTIVPRQMGSLCHSEVREMYARKRAGQQKTGSQILF